MQAACFFFFFFLVLGDKTLFHFLYMNTELKMIETDSVQLQMTQRTSFFLSKTDQVLCSRKPPHWCSINGAGRNAAACSCTVLPGRDTIQWEWRVKA
jgi:hypothetical protein